MEKKYLSLVEVKKVAFSPTDRRTRASQICGCHVTNDLQSGPVYCGAPADYFAIISSENPQMYAYVCHHHLKDMELRLANQM